ncbi:Acetyltransferase (GNAT) family protein [Clostridium amylolyticum]|uniref:Acetyltransferase (GNAT) family protein n=1 Tax=Clostridium amylolyticum TaxID=1121298 RepID=A0A1M6I9F5_9CLOT|nr:GNAT family N-acetyltransferase [Clostridium amylolyticum]SHJ31077.1 Acetyltransferase (GNAT) family protein [Clostridium amylolyticum]
MIIKENIKIEDFNVHGFDKVYSVYKRSEDFLSLGPEPYASREMVLSDIEYSKRNGGCYCTICCDNGVIGIIDFIPDMYEKQRGDAYINLIMIKEEYRNKNIGKTVIKIIEEWLNKEYRITNVFISVQENNTKGISFWVSLGYEVISKPELQDDGTLVLHMRKYI